MKIISSLLAMILPERGMRRNAGYFLRFMLALAVVVAIFSVLFHFIMEYEGRDYSWVTGLYWTLTVMSTLGFGDITFRSDLGMLFSIVVLLTGIVSLLIVLPTTFLQFVYNPWLESQKKKEVQHSLPSGVKNHIVIVGVSPITRNLAQLLTRYGYYSVLLCSNTQQALELMDQGLHVIVGDYDDSDMYRRLRADEARMVVALDTDVRNTNVAFSLREFAGDVPMVARAERDESIEILKLAGCTWVFQFRKALGHSLTRRVVTGRLSVSQLVTFGPLVIAETAVKQTALGGLTIKECDLRGRMGINVVGLWDHGEFRHPTPDTVLEEHMVMVMAGTREQIELFSMAMARELPADEQPGPVLVLGGGRVGTAAALALKDRGLDVVVVDKTNVAPYLPGVRVQVGDAADPFTLEKAGIKTAPSIIITTHDDDINTYLTIYCRRLRPDVQIISRTNLDRNVRVLQAAGANLVLSLASLVSTRIINLLNPGRVFMINEGLNIFRASAGAELEGKTLVTCGIRRNTRCNVVAVKTAEGEMLVNPDPVREFREGDELFLIGDSEAEVAYYERYWPDRGQELAEEESGPLTAPFAVREKQ
ncbi:potassium channel family protein [Mailhella sp.]|uniref:potassium channel family protein n=1 Tax=Mailhella sp. TaxID=1981029 RepID=UPI00406499FD